ncbi:MAG: C25 family cysteine peptidase, partial [Chloroflexota bacterium]
IVSPPPEFTFHCESTEVPAGTSLDIEVYAAEYEYECMLVDSLVAPALVLQGAEEQEIDSEAEPPPRDPGAEWMPVFEPPTCRDVARAVQKVEVFIDLDRDGTAELVDTWTPPESTRTSYTYGWDLGGLEPGRYYVAVRARLSDDTLMYETRHVEVATEGVSLEREVVPYGNFYQVSLTVVNQGSQTIDFDTIEDNLTSFQAVQRETDACKVYTEYCVETQQCLVNIDFRSDDSGWRVPLAPGQSLTASYLAVPIKQVAYVDGFRIGADDVVVTYDAQELYTEASFSRPVNPHVPPFELSQALNGADYLIVTNPGRLFTDAGPGNVARAHVDTLLSTMADLARWKNGTLGYLTVSSDMDVAFDPGSHDEVRTKIHSWGSHMQGSDGISGGYLSDGYLLIVGETEIVPSGTKEMNGRKYLSDEPKPTIHCTDMYYASTAGSSFNPQLKVGRIVGNDAVRLTSPLETSIAVDTGVDGHSFDRSQALLLSGWPSGRSGVSDYINFMAQCTAVQGIMEEMGTNSYILDSRLHESEESVTDEFNAGVPGSSIIHLAGHGNTWCCDELCAGDVIDAGNLFNPANPFVYAASCHTGQYEAGVSLAEAFLQSGAGAYLGTADVSYCCSGTRIAKTFYERWTHGKSLGTVLRELKRSMGDYNWRHPSWGYEEDIWTAQYQLYGDPKYGRGEYSQVAGKPEQESAGSTEPQLTVDVHVPGYTVTTEDEGDYIDIPGGFATLIPGRPIVPVYDVYLDYPAGQRVQDVRLADRSEAVLTTGLDIPEFERAVSGSDDSPASQTGDPLDWWPQVEYDWGVEENQDGSSTLAIRLYPFVYNQETTEARFYQDYSLDIDVTTSTVEILSVATDRYVYAEGDPVEIDVWLRNSSDVAADDLYIEAVVLDESSGEMVGSLPLEYLGGLNGVGSVKLAWDSGATRAGRYGVAVDVRDASGNVLDRSIVDVQVGICTGEVSSFEASPVEFEAGDEIAITMVFKNTGTVTLDGTAVVSVHDATGEVVEEFTHAVTSLAPGAKVTLSDTWDTSGATGGSHHVVGRVRYHSTATSPAVVTVTSLAEGSWPDEHMHTWLLSGWLRDNAIWAGSALVVVLLLGAVLIKARSM